jgi:2-dehydropantoate 2-reductase
MQPVTIVGAGGIGCAVGYALRSSGVTVRFVDADAAKVEWARAHGVQVDRRPPLAAEFVAFEEWRPTAADTVLLCTKCYDNTAVLARLHATVELIPIQNGFDPMLIQRCHASEGIASFISECLPHQTRTCITRAGKLHINGANERSREVVQRLRGTRLFRVEEVTDILPYKYSKLMYNAAISPLASAAGIDNGQLLAVPAARRLFFELLRENYGILHGAGIALAKIGPFHPTTVQRILRRRAVAEALAWAFYPSLRRTYCSMAHDLPAGRTEIDYYNGHLIHLAGDRPCPLNRAVYELVKRMVRERLQPHRGVFAQLLRTASEHKLAASV